MRKSFKKHELKRICGTHCVNCGSDQGIEYHHVVPLEIGGNDTLTNIVPLCHACHRAVTHHQHRLKYYGRATGGGRPRKIPQNYKDILADYFHCRIGKAETVKRLGLKDNRITSYPWYIETRQELGIVQHRNNIDLHAKKGIVSRSKGWIEYADGSHRIF